MKLIYILLLSTLLLACNERRSLKNNSLKFTSINNLSGNVILLKDPERRLNRIFIMPTGIEDSIDFMNSNIELLLKDKILIQLNYGCFSKAYSFVGIKMDTVKNRTCNMPFNGMLFVKANIECKNYEEFSDIRLNSNNKEKIILNIDSCTIKSIIPTDSSLFRIIKIYK